MTEETMPATEAMGTESGERDQYECAFHLLPTVADGEVKGVTDAIKDLFIQAGGTQIDEEMPQRCTLAYEITKTKEGHSQHFNSSWFGWIRFSISRDQLAHINTELGHRHDILRYLLIRLTKEESSHPQRFFEKKAEPATVVLSESDADTVVADVSDEDLNKSIEVITS